MACRTSRSQETRCCAGGTAAEIIRFRALDLLRDFGVFRNSASFVGGDWTTDVARHACLLNRS